MAAIAAVAYLLLIGGLFWLDQNKRIRTSPSLWISVIWLSLAGSRSVGQWLQLGAPVDSADQILEGSPIDRAAYAVLLVAGLCVLFSRGKRGGQFLRANGPVVWFFLYCAASFCWSDFADVSFKRWTKAVGDFVMVLIVVSDDEPIMAVKRLLSRASFLLIPLSVLFIKYYPNLGRTYGRSDYKAYFTGVTTNKNELGAICLLFGLASLWRLLDARNDREDRTRKRHLLAHSIILMMVGWLFWITNSMTALSSFVLAGIVLLAANHRALARQTAIIHFLNASVISIAVSALFLTTSLLTAIGRDPTLTDRTGIWSLVVKLTNPLIGTGFESFWLGPRLGKIWSVYTWGPLQAHNGYIEIFLNLGWIGVLLLGFVMISGYREVMASLRRKTPTASLMLAYFVVGVIFNCTEAAYFRMMSPTWILVLLAITRAPKNLSHIERMSTTLGSKNNATPSIFDTDMYRGSERSLSGNQQRNRSRLSPGRGAWIGK